MRKGRCIILIGSLFPLCIHGQILNTPYNLPRSGDRLMKCQIATIPPSKSGIQQIWNFANIKYQEANYELKYEIQGSDTINSQNYCLSIQCFKDELSVNILKVKAIIAITLIYTYVEKL